MSYSDNDSCSYSSSTKENTSSDDIADISTLRPFNFEPVMSKEEQEKLIISSSSSSDESENEDSRIGNNEWCLCGGHCRPMQSSQNHCIVVIQTKFQTKCLKV